MEETIEKIKEFTKIINHVTREYLFLIINNNEKGDLNKSEIIKAFENINLQTKKRDLLSVYHESILKINHYNQETVLGMLEFKKRSESKKNLNKNDIKFVFDQIESRILNYNIQTHNY